MIRVISHADVRAFLDRAEPWLLRHEDRYGLLYGVARLVQSGTHRYKQPIYWATVEEDGALGGPAVLGCAFRTPPHQVGVTELSDATIGPLVASLHEAYASVPGIGGPEHTATSFAKAWVARFGGSWSVHHQQRLHNLTAVRFPNAPAAGSLRLALPADVPVARAWMAGFIRDTGVRHLGADTAERLIEERRLYLWVDGQPRCMVGAVRDTPHTTGIAAVYTPAQFRNRGYASIAVATLSQQLLDAGRHSCFLYTDLANPVSNAVYRRIGYEPLYDVVDIAIV
ncbi:MAG TPA: GNAT family N-acetyltransferase [Gammaproteobacteria bacterium]|nr:GNAT family N-acetyltransferase [Gammaproteobacteria bacterium]